jgi:hypothetical protein
MIIRVDEKNSVELEEYQGTYSLASLRQGTDGKDYKKQWAKYRAGRDKYQDKDWPVKVTIGDRYAAIALCQSILAELSGNVPNEGRNRTDDDVPF